MSHDFYALLIGVNCYLPNKLPGGGFYGSLNGCVRDVEHVAAYLRDALHVPPAHITRLTSTCGPNGLPIQPTAELPTYENMVSAFKNVAGQAGAGDRVYIHYSGHGGRTTTAFPELKGADGLDEALVPVDIGNSEARYLRDVEMAYLLKSIVDKGAIVTVVLDSCHSGGATRGATTAVARGMTPGDMVKDGKPYDATVRPVKSDAGSHAELVAAWGLAAGGTRGVKLASGWLAQTQGYTLLAACRANELAYEDYFDGNERNGALTYWLLKSLATLPLGAPYKVLHDQLLARIRTWMAAQTPQLQGESDRAVFGAENVTTTFAILVADVDAPNNRVSLNAGEVHGLRRGTLLAAYPNGAADLVDSAGRLAILEVSELVGDADSWATIVTDFGRGNLDPGAQAVVIGTTDQRLQRTVGLALEDVGLATAMRDAIAANDAGFIRLAGTGDSVDFQVAVNGDCYEIWDRTGVGIPNLRPPVLTADAGAARRIAERLVHLTKYYNVRAVENPDAGMSGRIKVELSGEPAAGVEGNAPVYAPGQQVKLTVTNLLQPNMADINDATRILNLTVLILGYDYSIKQVYPDPLLAAFEIIQPGATAPFVFETELPAGYDEVTDILKVFVTQKTTDFRSLLLLSLDQAPTGRPRGTRNLTDPLDLFLAGFADDKAPAEEEMRTRARLVSAPSQPRPWATAQVELNVKKA